VNFNAPKRFSEAEDLIHEQAMTKSGLSDFGDPHYLRGLRMILRSMDVDPRFTPAGRQVAWDTLLMTLLGRLFSQQGFKDYPKCLDSKVDRPIVIMGLPRTGTTALHKLLAEDTQFQGLQNWLSICPMPRPPRNQWEEHPYFKIATDFNADFYNSVPEFRAIHNIVPDEVDECLEVTRQGFVSNRWAGTWTAHSYDAWWQTQNEMKSYQEYANVIRLIGHKTPEKRWLLKNPQHVMTVDELFTVFPDACVIFTHRDPRLAIASMCSTMTHIRRIFESEECTRGTLLLGPREMEKWAKALERSAPAIEKYKKQILDIKHLDFHNDPMATVRRIYEYFGLNLTQDAERAMVSRLNADPERSRGAHRYNVADYGLKEGELYERYKNYIEKYNLADSVAKEKAL